MVYDNMPHASMTVYPELEDRLILLDGWSKTYAMTGWRLGYAVWPRELVDHATRLAINIHSCVNAATQHAGIEALKGPQDAADRMVAAFDERRQVIVERLNALPGFRCVRPGGAFYAFPNISGTGFSARKLQDDLLNEVGVALVAGTSFGDQGEGYIRFSYANSVENIERAIDRIGNFLNR
jgi:aspartate/methionine/tyrosine aminotransferase